MTLSSPAGGLSLRLAHLSKGFGGPPAVDDLSIEVEGGSFLTILGASGSGKSTTLMLIAGFLDPDGGAIEVGGRNVVGLPPHRRDFGVVFQSYALFPHMRVADNVAFPLKMRGVSRADIRSRVSETLALVKLEPFAERLPRELSGGQQQRVALARALVARPRLLLMDEPLSALDRQLREHMQLELVSLQKRLGVTVVYVTHDQTEALVMSDRIAVMRGGRLEQFGTPREIYDRPRTRYVAEFIGESNLLDGTIAEVDGAVCRIQCGALSVLAGGRPGLSPGEPVQIAIRPERLKLGQPDLANWQDGIVEEAIYVGDALKLGIRTRAGVTLTVKAERDGLAERLRPGDAAVVAWRAEDVVMIDRAP